MIPFAPHAQSRDRSIMEHHVDIEAFVAMHLAAPLPPCATDDFGSAQQLCGLPPLDTNRAAPEAPFEDQSPETLITPRLR